MTTSWCVKITYLPQNITSEQLGQKFGVVKNKINIPPNQQAPHWYARVNGFENEDVANAFVRRWNQARVVTATIKCKAVATQFDPQPQPHLSSPRHRHACSNGIECLNAKCEDDHPPGWDVCEDGAFCAEFYCKANHEFGRTKPCEDGHECTRTPCYYLHPLPQMKECLKGILCRVWQCPGWHPKKRSKECSDGEQCSNIPCLHVHPSTRQICLIGKECTDLSCERIHPASRPTACVQEVACGNFHCEFLHPVEWDPCEAGVRCADSTCLRVSHPADRVLPLNQDDKKQDTPLPRLLKSVEQRNIERQEARLPMLAAKDEFCRRLEKERVLVVTAETGSGKSTQLPQYAAEYFRGLVVCTQPRVIAAISLARRVANEYDGISVGRSVGYRVGITSATSGDNRVLGTDILFMTDGSLIQESTEHDQLSHVRVLMIDEAHERSLNTDIVMGLAKLLLKKRPSNFYVVISSATIDPTKFLEFFEQSSAQPLQIPGRVYDVDVEYIPDSSNSIIKHAVSTVVRLYGQHEGSTLVFLPGQREIELAMTLFNNEIPTNCVAFPLYGVLSPEEQDRVLQFDGGLDGKHRMVVFCTNIAETSLTIQNTRLIIDSGLGKEASFNKKLRVTTIETTPISKASADQRKGRAGRTARGHCVRLYRENELIRPDIEPAILRSSLDLVVLQLIYLQLNPLEFPFIDPPAQTTIQESLEILEDLDCLEADDNLTLRGQIFVKLNFDPRFSAFLVDTYVEHAPLLELTTIITAILTAPGSLFLIGTTDEEKKCLRDRIAMDAGGYDSDLLYFASIYNKWCSVGAIDPATCKCPVCHLLCKKGNICRPCRAAYSTTHLLNNKILNIIENVCSATIKVIKNPRWELDPNTLSEVNESNIIGNNLFKYFPEHCGYSVASHGPNTNAFMEANNIRARISDTSVFVHQEVNNPHFIAMSIMKFPGGLHVIDRLHPFHPPAKLDDQNKSDNKDRANDQ